jgi:thiamine-monophosphate kinase
MKKGRVTLGGGREFDLIRKLLGPEQPLPAGIAVGPGDDCAVLDSGLVISTDLTVEGIHFRRRWLTPEEVGYRATAAALSDLAAMAAVPVGALISMALGSVEEERGIPASVEPNGFSPVVGEAGRSPAGPAALAVGVQSGADSACRREGIQIIGGDLTRSPGPLVINVVALGRADVPTLRAGARVGDEVWVTGWLGASRAAVSLWKEGHEPSEALREAFVRPKPRISEAQWLAERAPVRALIDISDGLGRDAGHLAAAGGVAVVLEEGAIPVHPALAGVGESAEGLPLAAHHLWAGAPARFALHGGEDYELCLAAPSKTLDEWVGPFQDSFAIPLTKVGRVVEGKGVLLETGGGDRVSVDGAGFDHFGSEGGDHSHEEDG